MAAVDFSYLEEAPDEIFLRLVKELNYDDIREMCKSSSILASRCAEFGPVVYVIEEKGGRELDIMRLRSNEREDSHANNAYLEWIDNYREPTTDFDRIAYKTIASWPEEELLEAFESNGDREVYIDVFKMSREARLSAAIITYCNMWKNASATTNQDTALISAITDYAEYDMLSSMSQEEFDGHFREGLIKDQEERDLDEAIRLEGLKITRKEYRKKERKMEREYRKLRNEKKLMMKSTPRRK